MSLLPGKLRGYYFIDKKTVKKIVLNKKTGALLEDIGYCFYKPLPQRKLRIRDLMLYMKDCLSVNDAALIVTAALAVTLVGMMIPCITKALTGPVLASGSTSVLISIAICLFCTSLSSQLLTSVREMYMNRVRSKTSLGIQASMMMRVMSLPADFFRRYSAGELTSRSMSVNSLCDMLLGTVMSTGLTSLMSLLYITQIFSFAPALVVPSLLMIVTTVLFSTVSSLVQIKLSETVMEHEAKESGLEYAMISGIQKIKLAGAEKRIFARWAGHYAEGAKYIYDPPTFSKKKGLSCLCFPLTARIA